MGTFSTLELIFLTIGGLVINFLAFYALFVGGLPKIRKLVWVVFFASMIELVAVWFSIFFPEFFKPKDSDVNILTCALLAFVSVIISAYFVWVWLENKRVHRLDRIVGKGMTIFGIICLFVITVVSVDTRLNLETNKKIVEESCVVDSSTVK